MGVWREERDGEASVQRGWPPRLARKRGIPRLTRERTATCFSFFHPTSFCGKSKAGQA